MSVQSGGSLRTTARATTNLYPPKQLAQGVDLSKRERFLHRARILTALIHEITGRKHIFNILASYQGFCLVCAIAFLFF